MSSVWPVLIHVMHFIARVFISDVTESEIAQKRKTKKNPAGGRCTHTVDVGEVFT